MTLEERLTELEMRQAFQDDALQQLSDEMLAQSRLIERLQQQVKALAVRQAELLGQLGDSGGEEPPPPHY